MAWNKPGEPQPPRNGGSRRGGGPTGPGWRQRIEALIPGDGGNPSLRWLWVVVGLWLIYSCFVLVTEQQRGVVLRFGQQARLLQPGPHLKLPWPIESVRKVNATAVQNYGDSVPVLTRDINMVTVELNVQYRISDPMRYLFGTRDANEVLKQAALSTVREQVGRSDLDTVLNSRGSLVSGVRSQLQASLDAYRTGLTITGLNLQNARPPEQVKDAFDEAQRATSDKQTAINEAQAYAAKVVPEARGEAARLRAGAIGYKTSLVARATGDAERFSLLVDQYKAAPDVTRKRLWLETVEDVVAKNRTVVAGDGRQWINVQMPEAKTAPKAAQPVPVSMPVVSAEAEAATSGVRPERAPRDNIKTEAGR